VKPAAAALAVALASWFAPASADPALNLTIATPLDITCETKAVAVAPEAKTTAGTLRVRLNRTDDGTTGTMVGTWTVIETATRHSASFAALQSMACKDGCPLGTTPQADARPPVKVELWAPRRATLDGISPNVALTVAALDLTAMTLRVSTFLDKQIAALEQGDCRISP
jgi:hypothetical protein